MPSVNQNEILSVKRRFEIIGNSPMLIRALEVAIQVAQTDMTVLISGESGSGKESFSKIIHSLSYRKHNGFIAINCGAIPEGTIDSELFGHEKGAFTGAHDNRKGYFEVTDGGTIFLDEIGEMPMSTQARLLRVLENGEFIKVGSSKTQKTDVRVVAATNVNLMKAIEEGKFREDLYYRLNTVPIFVPPLRERGDDLFLLFRKFAADYAEKFTAAPVQLTDDAKQTLAEYPFPGNIRQLKNLTDQISLLEEDRFVTARQLRSYLPRVGSNLPAVLSDEQRKKAGIDEKEKDLIYHLLYELKHDMGEMKKLIFQIVSDKRFDSEILNEHEDLFRQIEDKNYAEDNVMPLLLESSKTHKANEERQESRSNKHFEEEEDHYTPSRHHAIEDISHEATEVDEVLSLEVLEKEAIEKALKKHGNKRKYAAEVLGISERTLYRKIKQYDLE